MTMPSRPSILPANWDVPQVFRDRLGKRAGKQRAMFHEGHVLLILHAPPLADQAERAARFFWRKPDGSWQSSDFGSGPNSVDRHLAQYAELIQKYDDQEEHAETAKDYFVMLESIAPLQRATRNLHTVMQDARQNAPAAREMIDFRDRAYELERTIDLLYADTKTALEFAIAKRAEEQAHAARRMSVAAHRLNLMAGFFFPIATLSSVFGVNLIHGWENAPGPWPFIVMAGIGLFAGGILILFLTGGANSD